MLSSLLSNFLIYFSHHSNETVQITEAEHLSKLTECILAFRFIDHLMVMFAELPPWDLERKYLPSNLEVRSLTFLPFSGLVSCVLVFFSVVRLSSFECIKAMASLPVDTMDRCEIRIWRATFTYKLRRFPDVLMWIQN